MCTQTHIHTHIYACRRRNHLQYTRSPVNKLYCSTTGADWTLVSPSPPAWRGFYGSAMIYARRPLYPQGGEQQGRVETIYTATHSSLTILGGLNCWAGCNNIDSSATGIVFHCTKRDIQIAPKVPCCIDRMLIWFVLGNRMRIARSLPTPPRMLCWVRRLHLF